MRPYLHRVQVLRFAAAAMVLFGHVQIKAGQALDPSQPAFEALGHAGFWASGVDLFFVISGFVMYLVSRDEFGRQGAGKAFFMRRLARVGPPYWVVTTAMVLATLLIPQHLLHGQATVENVLASYFFLPSVNAYGDPYPVLVLGWTLNFEMLFYLLFALALRWRRPIGLAILCGALATMATIGAIAPPAAMPMAFWFNPIVLEFLFGILLGCLHARGQRIPPVLGASLLLASVALLFVGSAFSAASPFWPWRALGMGLPALLLCASAVLTREPDRVGAIGRFLARAGDASYVLYLTHPFSLALVLLAWPQFEGGGAWDYVAASCLVSLAIALFLHRVIERPAVAWLVARTYRMGQFPLRAASPPLGRRA